VKAITASALEPISAKGSSGEMHRCAPQLRIIASRSRAAARNEAQRTNGSSKRSAACARKNVAPECRGQL
jgi:hypothetical protein